MNRSMPSMLETNRKPRRSRAGWWGLATAMVAGLAVLAYGGFRGAPWLLLAGVVVAAGSLWLRRLARCTGPTDEPTPEPLEPPFDENPNPRPVPACGSSGFSPPRDPAALVQQMLAQGRYALLLRPRVAKGLSREQVRWAFEMLQREMALVPDGEVVLGPLDQPSEDVLLEENDWVESNRRVVRVEAFFLDRHPVTNRQYFEFTAGGGYQQPAFWDPTILPAMLDFVDRTGQPGPRFWKNGCYLVGQENHPVVGVCWHEAMAYARWIGKRLPTNAEWTKAGSWPVPISDTQRSQRRYPWGDTMDRHRANLWGSGPERVVPVESFPDGVSVGGVYQLVGNVWEWTSGDYDGTSHPRGDLTFDTPLKSLRGGAYDTYFDSQATCQFLSGDSALARKRNIGFRVALGVCDLALGRAEPAESDQTDVPEEAVAQEVEA